MNLMSDNPKVRVFMMLLCSIEALALVCIEETRKAGLMVVIACYWLICVCEDLQSQKSEEEQS